MIKNGLIELTLGIMFFKKSEILGDRFCIRLWDPRVYTVRINKGRLGRLNKKYQPSRLAFLLLQTCWTNVFDLIDILVRFLGFFRTFGIERSRWRHQVSINKTVGIKTGRNPLSNELEALSVLFSQLESNSEQIFFIYKRYFFVYKEWPLNTLLL